MSTLWFFLRSERFSCQHNFPNGKGMPMLYMLKTTLGFISNPGAKTPPAVTGSTQVKVFIPSCC